MTKSAGIFVKINYKMDMESRNKIKEKRWIIRTIIHQSIFYVVELTIRMVEHLYSRPTA